MGHDETRCRNSWIDKAAVYDNPVSLGAFTYNLRFPGQLYDPASQLSYNYYRDYNSRTGRYIESDPIGLEGGINTYAYVENNPLSYSDPTGENPIKVLGKVLNKAGIEVEGIKPNRKGDGGQFCQVLYKRQPIFRVEVHPFPGTNGLPRAHYHIIPNMKKHRELPDAVSESLEKIIKK